MSTIKLHAVMLVAAGIASISQPMQANERLTPKIRPKQMGIHATFIRLNDQSRPLFQTNLRTEGDFTTYQYGERIDRVQHGSPAQRAGLERGDVIVATYPSHLRHNLRQPIRNRDQLHNAIRFSGDRLRLVVRNRRNGRYQEVTVYFDQHDDDDDGPRPFLR